MPSKTIIGLLDSPASGYLNKLISNPAIERYLERKQPEMLAEFRVVVTSALDQASQPI